MSLILLNTATELEHFFIPPINFNDIKLLDDRYCLLRIIVKKGYSRKKLSSFFKLLLSDIVDKSEQIKREFGKGYNYFYYKNYSKTNNLHTLISANQILKKKDTVICFSDILTSSSVISKIINPKISKITILGDLSKVRNGTMKIKANKNNLISIGKLPRIQSSGNYIGILKIPQKKMDIFKNFLIKSKNKNKDYYFVEEVEFERLIKNQEFLEYAKVFNNFYGTTRTPVINNLNKGKNVLFDIDWQGADQIKNKKLDYKLITFFILPPSKDVLFKRLSSRDMKDKLIAEERMKQFGRDVLHWINYDYVVINDDLDNCFSKIKGLIDAEINNGSKDYDKEFIRKHVEKLTG